MDMSQSTDNATYMNKILNVYQWACPHPHTYTIHYAGRLNLKSKTHTCFPCTASQPPPMGGDANDTPRLNKHHHILMSIMDVSQTAHRPHKHQFNNGHVPIRFALHSSALWGYRFPPPCFPTRINTTALVLVHYVVSTVWIWTWPYFCKGNF